MKNKLRLLLAPIIVIALVLAGCNIRPDDLVVDDSDLIPALLPGGTRPAVFPNSNSVPNFHNAWVVDLGDRWYVSADFILNDGQIGQSFIHGGVIRYQMIIAKDRMDFFADPANERTLQVTVTISGTSSTSPQSVGGMCFWKYFNDRLASTKQGIIDQGTAASLLSAPVFIRDVAPQTNRSLAGAGGNQYSLDNRQILDELGISLNLMIPLTLRNPVNTFTAEGNPAWPGMPNEMPHFGWGQIR